MSLPLPNLDTRRWADLVEEGLAQIIRTSPGWTDHNASDPGVTLLELLAFEVEREIFRANRISDAQQLKYLALAGPEFRPRGPRPATLLVKFRRTANKDSAPPGASVVPRGVELVRRSPFAPGRAPTPFWEKSAPTRLPLSCARATS